MNLLDIFLFPKRFFNRLTGRMDMLVLGIFFIGVLDMAVIVIDNFKGLFVGNEHAIWNILILILLSILIGVIDVMFFGIPLFDLFKIFKKESEPKDNKVQRIKLFKVYITSHTVIVPVQIILQLVFTNNVQVEEMAPMTIFILLFLYPVILVWFNAIITRGINVIYNFTQVFRSLVFPAVMIWNFFLGEAINFMQINWFTKLFFL